MADEGIGKLTADTVREMVDSAVEEVSARTQPDQVRDPITGEVNVYATRLRERLAADMEYMALQRYLGHEQTCQLVCTEHGHEARAGRCMRCGQAVSGAEVRAQRTRRTTP